jgi:hypothetical protein
LWVDRAAWKKPCVTSSTARILCTPRLFIKQLFNVNMSEKDPSNVSEYRRNSYTFDNSSPDAELKQPFENVQISKPFNPFPEAVVVDPVIAGREFILV